LLFRGQIRSLVGKVEMEAVIVDEGSNNVLSTKNVYYPQLIVSQSDEHCDWLIRVVDCSIRVS